MTAVLGSDPHAAYDHLILKYFVAQGLAVDHSVYLVSKDGKDLVDSCMWISKTSFDDEQKDNMSTENVQIAWRYEGMKKFETTVSPNTADQ